MKKSSPYHLPKLSRLDTKSRAAIFKYGEAHTLEQTLRWLAANGVRISQSALSNWLTGQRTPKLPQTALADIRFELRLLNKKLERIISALLSDGRQRRAELLKARRIGKGL